MDLGKFKLKQIINENVTQKTLYMLGTFEGMEGQAILILTPKKLSPQQLTFHNTITIFQNDIYSKYQSHLLTTHDIQSIFPITQKHRIKYMRKVLKIYPQTQQLYEQGKHQLLERQLKHINWVQNILNGKAQVERVLLNQNDFIILPDFKFNDFNNKDVAHLLLIFRDPTLHSLRDLNQNHIQILEKAQKAIDEVLQTKLNLKNQCKLYFHYPPTFYQLHIHIMNTKLASSSSSVERCYQLSSVVDNLKIKGNYYKQARLNIFKEQS